ncbi:MAG TPA: OmpA family protein [Methylobacter sp.]|jgi:outer membrane protein OmpA-like peptidoglycan-associated protein
MRSVITEISSKLFGLSILVFILALLMPLLREWPLPAEKGDTVEYELPSSFKETNDGLEPELRQSSATDDGLKAPVTQPQGEVAQNQSNGLTESAQNMELEPELTQSPATDNGLKAPITQPQGEVAQNQSNGLTESAQNVELEPELTQSPATDDGLKASVTPQNQSSELTESTKPVGDSGFPSSGAEKKRSSQHEPINLLVLGGGFFSSGQVTPSADTQDAIDKIIPLIKTRPLYNVVVEGHADKWVPNGLSPVQVSKLNQSVSLRRAKAIALVLKQRGIASDRIIVHGLGDTVPLASNLTYEGRAKNRRVEIKLLPIQ